MAGPDSGADLGRGDSFDTAYDESPTPGRIDPLRFYAEQYKYQNDVQRKNLKNQPLNMPTTYMSRNADTQGAQ